MALDVILSVVTPEMIRMLAVKKTAKRLGRQSSPSTSVWSAHTSLHCSGSGETGSCSRSTTASVLMTLCSA